MSSPKQYSNTKYLAISPVKNGGYFWKYVFFVVSSVLLIKGSYREFLKYFYSENALQGGQSWRGHLSSERARRRPWEQSINSYHPLHPPLLGWPQGTRHGPSQSSAEGKKWAGVTQFTPDLPEDNTEDQVRSMKSPSERPPVPGLKRTRQSRRIQNSKHQL